MIPGTYTSVGAKTWARVVGWRGGGGGREEWKGRGNYNIEVQTIYKTFGQATRDGTTEAFHNIVYVVCMKQGGQYVALFCFEQSSPCLPVMYPTE